MKFSIVIGGLIGLAVDGWRGALVGALLAWALMPLLGRLLLGAAVGKIQRVQTQFLDSTFAVMGAMCKADGQVTNDEIRVAEALFEKLQLSGEARESAKRAFQRGKEPDFDLDAEVARFAAATGGQRMLQQMFIQVQISAMAADGEMHPAEHTMLLRIARTLGFSAEEIANLEALLDRASQPGSAGGRRTPDPRTIDEAYAVLGVPASASDVEVKRAYRQRMSQNHPDKLAAKGLPESMRSMAEEKTREIAAAYERIEQARQAIKGAA